MIESAEETITTCQRCGAPIEQKPGRGHRPRLYCDDRGKCRQRAHRAKQKAIQSEREALDRLQQVQVTQIAELETEITDLKMSIRSLEIRLNVEDRFRTDIEVRHFKSWLRKHPQARDTDFFKRFLDDTRLPQHASRSLYVAWLRRLAYTDEDIMLFEEAWKDMLFLL